MAHCIRRTSKRYDLDALTADVREAMRALDFGAGAFAHSISLPAPAQIAADFRDHRNNVPFANVLDRCGYLRQLFDGFQTEKAGLRLLRRRAGTAYSLHDDRDIGRDIVRLQLPVSANPGSFLLMQRAGVDLQALARRVAEFADGQDSPISFDFPRLVEVFGRWLMVFPLECGYFHRIDTDKVHSLVNGGTSDRVTLCIDLIRNDWLDQWLAAHLDAETPALERERLPAGHWDWSALRHGLLTHPRIAPV